MSLPDRGSAPPRNGPLPLHLGTDHERDQALLRVASRLSRLGWFSVDLRDGTRRWSEETFAIHGLHPGEAPGLEAAINFYAPEYRDTMRRLYEGCTRDGIPYDAELELITTAGRRVWVRTIAEPERDASGRIIGMHGALQDITERKRLETQVLAAQRLESLGTLAGGIAHDLNNVLSPILTAIELLRMDDADPDRLELLATMERSALRGADLVRQVLLFARGVEGHRRVVSPAEVVRDAEKIIRETFPKDIVIRVNVAPALWSVHADTTQLHQVVMNLCVNARDALALGGDLDISVENVTLDETYAGMHPGSHPGDFVRIRVADSGVGIPQEIQERIFEPFFTTKEVGKGTGLGLSTSLAIVRRHGGFVHVHSAPGRGTRMDVYLPATSAHASAADALQDASVPRGSGELLLVVDDEEAIRRIMRRTLERFGYRVVVAGHGGEALNVYRRQRDEIAAVITDMAMPVMDGPALILALKAMDPDVRIIGSSGYAFNDSVAKAMGAGVRHFVSKPYTADAMLRTLRELLDEGTPGA